MQREHITKWKAYDIKIVVLLNDYLLVLVVRWHTLILLRSLFGRLSPNTSANTSCDVIMSHLACAIAARLWSCASLATNLAPTISRDVNNMTFLLHYLRRLLPILPSAPANPHCAVMAQ